MLIKCLRPRSTDKIHKCHVSKIVEMPKSNNLYKC